MVLQQQNSMEDEIDNLSIRIEPMFHIFYGLNFSILMPLIKHFDLWRGPLIVSFFFFLSWSIAFSSSNYFIWGTLVYQAIAAADMTISLSTIYLQPRCQAFQT